VTRRRAGVLIGSGLALAVAALLLVPEAPPRATGNWLRAAALEPRFETLDGLRVRYVRAGSGSPLVLLHGFASSIFSWKDVIGPLARAHDVVALDLPGFGASDQPADLSYEHFPRAVLGLLDRLGVQRATLVGSSMGGAVAVLLAARAPARVERLVLIDAAGFNLAPADRPAVVRLVSSRAAPLLERLPLRRAATRLALRQVFHDDALVTEERVEEYLAPLARPGTLASLRSLTLSRAASAPEFEALARSVRAPTLILWGREDVWIPVAHADRFAAAIPGARKVVLENCGHLPQEERPADVVRLIEEFAAGTSRQ
jgi:pimeloyl-ACP methyl ester carboxylesterase